MLTKKEISEVILRNHTHESGCTLSDISPKLFDYAVAKFMEQTDEFIVTQYEIYSGNKCLISHCYGTTLFQVVTLQGDRV
jgi:hypothetical protein